ncbi:extracellular solute-binding protein [Microbacterium sp.]|uniref:ABC transporter substrate-binding protein n=1 Tax=Microbacterium sp. TaxID=51671 RepID=UPI002810ADC8|nr:extracellular solute-binding protein [Microbacterium sp.]
MKFTSALRVATAAVAIGSLASLAACSSSAAPPAEPGGSGETIEIPGASAEATEKLNELYQAAVESGNTDIVFYGPSASTSQALLEVFTDRFPEVSVTLKDMADAQILTTMQTEAATGQRVGDLWWGGDSIQAAREADICTPIDVVTGPEGWDPPTAEEDRLIYFAYRMFGFAYNSDEVSEDEVPKSWNDLLEPEWKGKIAMGDPNAGALRHIFTGMLRPDGQKDKFGEEFIEDFAAQDLQYVDPERNVSAEIASGRFPVGAGVFYGYYLQQKEKGANVEFVFPLEGGGNFLSRSSLCAAKDGPAAEATELFVNWIFTEEGQQALAEKDLSYGNTPTAPGPEGMASLDKIDKLPFANPDPEFNKPFFEYIEKTFKNPNAQ